MMDDHTSYKEQLIYAEKPISQDFQIIQAAVYNLWMFLFMVTYKQLSDACSYFLTSHPGQTIWLKDVAKLLGIIFARSATFNNAIKGF